MKEHIEVSIEVLDKQVDFAIPVNVTAQRLIVLLSQVFKDSKQDLPENWNFVVKGKAIALESGLTLKELGLGNGEILKIMVGEEYEMF